MTRRLGRTTLVGVATGLVRASTLMGVDKRFRQLVQDALPLVRLSLRLLWWASPDHILVLEGGRILESGSHDALVALGGRYATLFEMQAGRYR